MSAMSKLSKIHSVVAIGLDPRLVEVEVDIGAGIPSLTIVGLPDKAVEEAKERVRLALKNSGFDFPPKKIVVNLAPADVKKEGPSYDLPIAVGVLVAGGVVDVEKIKNTIFLGELALSGEVRATKGVVQAAILAKKLSSPLVAPMANSSEAELIPNIEFLPVENLKDLILKLIEAGNTPPPASPEAPACNDVATSGRKQWRAGLFQKTKKFVLKDSDDFAEYDFANIVGQSQAKRALEIAAAGNHNVLLFGSPGGGKTLLSRSIVSILPPMDEDEVLEVTKIYSVAGLLSEDEPIVTRRPFRSPHHTTSAVAIVGGGTYPKPGEVSLAHKGVLFFDEFPEFPRSVLEALRQPLEDKVVTVSRAQGTLHFPADFILVSAKNPCPCGYAGDETHECSCTTAQVIAYNRKISGPLLDRIDLQIQVGKIPFKSLSSSSEEESSKTVRQRVSLSRKMQYERSLKLLKKVKLNGSLSKKELELISPLPLSARNMLEGAIEKFDLTMRSYLKIYRVARTIADLQQSQEISEPHIAEALQYRMKENGSL